MSLIKFLKPDGTYDLVAALKAQCADRIGKPAFDRAVDHIDQIEELVPIRKPIVAEETFRVAVSIALSAA